MAEEKKVLDTGEGRGPLQQPPTPPTPAKASHARGAAPSAPTPPLTPSKGDTVWYVPDECHGYERQPDGRYAWQFARKSRTPRRLGGRRGEEAPPQAEAEPLTDEDVFNTLKGARGRRSNAADDLEPLGPQVRWPATVVGVVVVEGEGNQLSLDIANPCLPGVTLHYTVPQDETEDPEPHTWHAQEPEPPITAQPTQPKKGGER